MRGGEALVWIGALIAAAGLVTTGLYWGTTGVVVAGAVCVVVLLWFSTFRRLRSMQEAAASQARLLAREHASVRASVEEVHTAVMHGLSERSREEIALGRAVDTLASEMRKSHARAFSAVTGTETAVAALQELCKALPGELSQAISEHSSATELRMRDIDAKLEQVELKGRLLASALGTLNEQLQVVLHDLEKIGATVSPAGGGGAPALRGGEDPDPYLYFLSYHIPREIEATIQLYRNLEPDGWLPLSGGWALSPTGIFEVVRHISAAKAKVVLECGSGTSTLWFALALRRAGGGHVYALEHKPAFAARVTEMVKRYGLEPYATVIHAPIVEAHDSGQSSRWYCMKAIAEISDIDVLVVDGPPKAVKGGRAQSLPKLHSRLSGGAHVFVDDVNRSEERAMVEQWLKDYSDLRREVSATPLLAHLYKQVP